GGEKVLIDQVMHDLRCRGLSARVAIADTLGAAWAFAHALKSGPVIIPSGKHRVLLERLDLALLRIPHLAVRQLHEFGIRGGGQLMHLPRGEVVVRFGRDVLLRLDQALGDVPEVIRPERFVEPVAACWDFEEPTAQRWMLEKVLKRLLQGMLERLTPDQL